jgi:hypothetical protein
MDEVLTTKVSDDLAERVEEFREGGQTRSGAMRNLIRRGLEAEDRRQELRDLRDERETANKRAREAVDEMQDVRRQWERERRRVIFSLLIATAGLALIQTTGRAAIGFLLTGIGVAGAAMLVGGIVDWIAGRREGLAGLTKPPEATSGKETPADDLNSSAAPGGNTEREENKLYDT